MSAQVTNAQTPVQRSGVLLASQDTTASPPQRGNVQLQGTLEAEARWLQHSDVPMPGSGSATDLYLRRLELAVTGMLPGVGSGIAVVNTENLGDSQAGGDGAVVLDEAHVDLRGGDVPLYLVAGVRTQPFGLFENSLLTDPLTQDAYETKKVGVTVGVAGPRQVDFSVTAYKGQELMDQLFAARLFDTTGVTRTAADVQHVNSFIVSGTATPWEDHLSVFGALSSEPGYGRRNSTLDVGLTLTALKGNAVLDVEYAKALQREDYEGVGRPYEEGALTTALSYVFVARARTHRGNANFRGRRSHLEAHPFEIALRYEHFDDDGLSHDLGIWTSRDRYGVGGRYTFVGESGVSLYGMAEYTFSTNRVPAAAASSLDDANHRITVRLGMAF